MKTLIRLFDYNSEKGAYNEFVYHQWENEFSLPVPHVGEYLYTSPNGCETARVDSVTYSMPHDSSDNYIIVDLNVTLIKDSFGDEYND